MLCDSPSVSFDFHIALRKKVNFTFFPEWALQVIDSCGIAVFKKHLITGHIIMVKRIEELSIVENR